MSLRLDRDVALKFVQQLRDAKDFTPLERRVFADTVDRLLNEIAIEQEVKANLRFWLGVREEPE